MSTTGVHAPGQITSIVFPLFQQESNNVPDGKNSDEPMDKEEALKAYHGLCESKK